ncbi:hypothetical protein F5B17DRAFT_24363 [Nemania serpens]|nr:hypothetical protein F5B17DRAFT_24363 [Nemania serpens]
MSSVRAALAENGYVIQRQILSGEELEALRGAAARTTERARTGNWPDVRTVGKQFPPWPRPAPGVPPEDGIWGVQGLLNPGLGPDAAVFAASYFHDKVLDVAKALLTHEDGDEEEEACTDDDLVLELYNLLVRPESDFELEWHRDDVPRTATPEEEAAKLGIAPAARRRKRDTGTRSGTSRCTRTTRSSWSRALTSACARPPSAPRRAASRTCRGSWSCASSPATSSSTTTTSCTAASTAPTGSA